MMRMRVESPKKVEKECDTPKYSKRRVFYCTLRVDAGGVSGQIRRRPRQTILKSSFPRVQAYLFPRAAIVENAPVSMIVTRMESLRPIP